MTQMIYRPRTDQQWLDKRPIVKTQSLGIDLDALVVGEDEREKFVDWFDKPSDLLPKPKTKKAKVNDDSIKAD